MGIEVFKYLLNDLIADDSIIIISYYIFNSQYKGFILYLIDESGSNSIFHFQSEHYNVCV